MASGDFSLNWELVEAEDPDERCWLYNIPVLETSEWLLRSSSSALRFFDPWTLGIEDTSNTTNPKWGLSIHHEEKLLIILSHIDCGIM